MATANNTADPVTCERYYEKNVTSFLKNANIYEGIPENLAINVVVWLVLLLTFSFLRRMAWNYGRIALVSSAESRILRSHMPLTHGTDSRYNVWTTMFYGEPIEEHEFEESLDESLTHQEQGFFSWIPAYFRITDAHILRKTGPDGIQFLTFQRYLIAYTSIVTVLSIGVILPCNFQGEIQGDRNSFGHTTIANLPGNSPILWVHSVFSVLYLILAIVFMRHFSVNLQFEVDEEASRTLMISNIPKEHCFKNPLVQHFSEAYPDVQVHDIQFAYDIKKLWALDAKRQKAREARLKSEIIYQTTGQRPEMVLKACGQCCGQYCCICCHPHKVDCIEYYKDHEEKYHDLCEEEKVEAFKNTLGIAFVTFGSESIAKRAYLDFKISCRSGVNAAHSSVARMLEVQNWEVGYAPSAEDLYWQSLSQTAWVWWTKAIFFNFLLFILLFFLTTPSVFLSLLSEVTTKISIFQNPLINQFLPTLLLLAMAALLPNLVLYVEVYCVGHTTRSSEHLAVMTKTFVYLVLMVLVLPSLGLTSANALFDWIKKDSNKTFRWECVFVPHNGAFFVNYVITAAFIGTAMELLRLPDLIIYFLRLCLAKSAAERSLVTKNSVWEFQFGSQYAWVMCVFSVIMAFSVLSPMITPFGLIYLVLKHMVNRYNMYFAYCGSKINKKIHTSAIMFVIVALILQQATVLAFIVVRGADHTSTAKSIFLTIAFSCTLSILIGRVCCGVFRGLSPVVYKPSSGPHTEGNDKTFVPTILLEEQTDIGDVKQDAVTAAGRSYGATGSTNAATGSTNGTTGSIDRQGEPE